MKTQVTFLPCIHILLPLYLIAGLGELIGCLLSRSFDEIPRTGLKEVGDAASPQKQKAGDPASPYKRAGGAHLLK